MKTYLELKQKQPPSGNYFFAFNNEQFKEQLNKKALQDEKIYSGGSNAPGLYGTKEALETLFTWYDELIIEIGSKCDPQAVYDYEYSNHECQFTGDDTEPLQMVIDYFGLNVAKAIRRKYGSYSSLDIKLMTEEKTH